MGFLSYLGPARDLFYKQKDAKAAEEALRPYLNQPKTPEEKRAVNELLGLTLRQQKKFAHAGHIYEKMGDLYQAGYCAMLLGDLDRTRTLWSRLLAERQNHWCLTLFGMITQQLQAYPTLFQIRNHIECDITALIAANQLDYLEKMLSYIDCLTQVNLETPKFTGRALMYADWLDRAGAYLIQGQKALPNDPEIYFHLGQYSIALQHYQEARLMLKQCLLISPTYRPAAELLEKTRELA